MKGLERKSREHRLAPNIFINQHHFAIHLISTYYSMQYNGSSSLISCEKQTIRIEFQFATLLKGGKSYKEYVENEIKALKDKQQAGTLTEGESNQLISLNMPNKSRVICLCATMMVFWIQAIRVRVVLLHINLFLLKWEISDRKSVV